MPSRCPERDVGADDAFADASDEAANSMKSKSQVDLTAKLKGSRRAYVAEFLKQREIIAAYLRQGHSYRVVYEHLADEFSFGYDTFRRYAAKMIPEPDRTPPPLRRTPSNARQDPAPTSAHTARLNAIQRNPLHEPRERDPYDYSGMDPKAKELL